MVSTAGSLSTTIRQPMMTCPACDKSIEAEVALRADPPDGDLTPVTKEIRLTATMVGLKIEHDCLPKATRSRGRPPGARNRPKPAPNVPPASEDGSEGGPTPNGELTPEQRRAQLKAESRRTHLEV